MAEQGRATGGTSHLSIPAPQGTSSGGRGGLKASSTAAVSRGVGGGAGGGGGGGRKRRSGAAGLQHLQLVEEASGGGSESAAAAAGVSAGGSSWSSSSIEQQTTAASSGSTAGERKKLRLLDETSLPGPSKPGPSSLKKKRPSSSSGSSKKSKLNPDEQEVPKSAASSETSAGSSSSQSQRLKSSRVKSKLPLPTKSSEKGSSKTAQKQDKKQTEEPSNYLNVEPSALGKSSDKTSKRSLKRETSSSEASGSGVKKLLNHYSLRSQDKVQRNQPEIKSKKNSATDSSGGTSSNISESGDKESKSHKRTSATTGSCTSTSRGRWGGGGGGNSATGTGAGGGAGGSSSKGGDCGAMSDEVPPPTGDSPAPSGAGNGNSGGGGGGTAGGGGGVDSESDDSEVGRLQALLEARGLPPHLFGALAPRMHHLLHRTIGTNTSTKAQQLLAGLQATSDEGQQMQAVIEMCQMLVMGNEDTLAGFPVKQVVPALIALLNMEHNFDMMNHACRALTYMMEALPRSSAVVLDAVPVFLEKLQAIQCMDVAEQSLTALEMLSRRHSKAILQARGVWACLMYLDFFSINAQRSALAITANCCHNLLPEELHLVSQSIPLLASRLTQQDQKSVESVCLALSRLVEALQCDPPKLMQIASTELLTNLQQLLVVSPPLINTGTFITVVRMLTTMCSCCPELALTLLKNNIAETLCYLLTGRADSSQGEMELTSRSPAEVYEMTCLIGELMPRLPAGGLFAVDILLERPSPRSPGAPGGETVTWQWRDDAGIWHPYAPIDSKIIEAAHQTGEDEMSLSTFGRTYTVDFHSMQQINEDTGTARPVERRVVRPPPSQLLPNSLHQTASSVNNNTTLPTQESEIDANLRDVAGSFIRSLFSVLYEVYSSSAGPAVRHKCLKALLRMVYFATPQLLKEVLKAQMVSSQLAGMMASSDLRIVVSALQMAEILMQKLPDVFSIHFTREGVMHEIKQLADPNVPVGASPMKSSPASISSSPTTDTSTPGPSSSAVAVGATALASLSGGIPPTAVQQAVSNGALYTRISSSASGNPAENNPEELINVEDDEMPLSDCSPITRRMRELRKQKRSKRDKHKQDADVSPNIQELIAKHKQHSNALGLQSNRGNKLRLSGATSKTSNFLASLNPARWGRASDRTGYHKVSFHKESSLSKCSSTSNLWAGNREKVRSWVKERAAKFVANYASLDNNSSQDPSRILESLMKAIATLQSAHGDKMNALIELRDTLMGCDISPFEVNHSGLVKALLEYLTSKTENRETRIRTFLHVFANLPLEETGRDLSRMDPSCLQALVSKLNSCVSQLEQFPVKVHDLPAPAGSTTALKFFNTHQLKCQLARHPDCSSLKQWRGGTVKIDPLALVQAIERYLVVRGYAKVRDKHSTASDDDNSDDEFDDNMVGMVVGSARHKLQFLINDVVLPYNMTVYQAVKQFSPAANSDQSETDTDTEAPLGSANIWVQTHTVHYRPVLEEETSSKPATGAAGSSLSSATAASGIPRKGKGSSSKAAPKKKHDDLWNDGQIPRKPFPLDRYLVTELNSKVSTCDASLPVLCLLNALHAISIHWPVLYPAVQGRPLLLQTEFVNNKIAAKAGRQLQDPLVIMTGNLPPWLQQITSACPFLMPFETRQLLLYATAFDRDRALQRLLDSSPELGSGADSQERVTPRLDRRKRTVSRDDILKQAEALLQDMATSKALLEVQYENEVGTGLGPTLEFYALVSRELQRSELELWHSEEASTPLELSAGYVHSPVGLFPAPIPRTARVSQLMKLRNKFRFIGRFMAKAVMDSRMLDLPLSQTFHRWLLGEESSLGLADLAHVAPSVHRTLARLMSVVAQVNEISASSCLTEEEKKSRMEGMELDGCPIADLGLDFTLPGYPHVELRKNGKDISVTAYNLESYCKLVVHWFLVEGVQRQMECVREGMQCVFPTGHLGLFYPAELDAVFCGSGTDWDITSLVESCRPDHGYNQSSRAIKFLFDILSSYNREEQRDFVQFVTGSPRLPVGGFRALSPPLTIVRKTMDGNMNADDYLPSVMTCVNYLKLPDYSSLDIMKEKLRIAARDGQCSFHLS